MIVSDDKKFIMFCPPKVGSSTLTSRLQEYDSRDNFFYQPRWNEELFKIEELKHITYLEFLNYKDSELLKNYFKFCFVRNPYDRVYSGFLMRCHHVKNVKHPRLDENKEYLNKLNHYLQKNEYSFNKSLKLLIDIEDMGFIPLNRYTHFNSKLAIDYIGYNEKFEEDFKEVCTLLNISNTPLTNRIIRTDPKPSSNPHEMNMSDYKYLEYYQRSTIEFVNDYYNEDFEYFGYKKMNPLDFPVKIDSDIDFSRMYVKK